MFEVRTVSGVARLFVQGIDRGDVRYEFSEHLGRPGNPAEGRLIAAQPEVLDIQVSPVTLLTADGDEFSVAIDGVELTETGATAHVRSDGDLSI